MRSLAPTRNGHQSTYFQKDDATKVEEENALWQRRRQTTEAK